MPAPAEVYYLSPTLEEGFSKGKRPHVSVSRCAPEDDVVTLAYGSSRDTDALSGAPHVLVDPSATRYWRTGLSKPTYFYLSRLIGTPAEDLPDPSGRIIREMPLVLKRLRSALGFGTGVTREPNSRGANRRGRIAIYTSDITSELGTDRCLIVTDPAYSRQGIQQITIPLLDASAFESRPGDVPVPIRPLSPGPEQNLFAATSMIFSVYERRHLEEYTPHVIDPRTLRSVENALALHFAL